MSRLFFSAVKLNASALAFFFSSENHDGQLLSMLALDESFQLFCKLVIINCSLVVFLKKWTSIRNTFNQFTLYVTKGYLVAWHQRFWSTSACRQRGSSRSPLTGEQGSSVWSSGQYVQWESWIEDPLRFKLIKSVIAFRFRVSCASFFQKARRMTVGYLLTKTCGRCLTYLPWLASLLQWLPLPITWLIWGSGGPGRLSLTPASLQTIIFFKCLQGPWNS